MKEELKEAAVAAVLGTKWIGRSYQYLERASSTNDLLKQRVAGGGAIKPPSGAVLLTDYQEEGRGRFDRTWEAPPFTSLLFSIIFRPDWDAAHLPWLTMLAGLSVAEAVEKETELPAFLKWPNDVVVNYNDNWSKVCGILLEGTIAPSQRLEYAVLGIGINVNIAVNKLPPAAQPVTSLMIAAGRRISRLSLLVELLERLELNYEAADRGDSPQQLWNERLVTLGQRVEVHRVGQKTSLTGTAEATDEWGRLLLRDDEGQMHTIVAADVTLRDSRS